ncbi:MAG: hypothetical protein ACRDVG_07745 [Jatrophihabitantaceae bacterium]
MTARWVALTTFVDVGRVRERGETALYEAGGVYDDALSGRLDPPTPPDAAARPFRPGEPTAECARCRSVFAAVGEMSAAACLRQHRAPGGFCLVREPDPDAWEVELPDGTRRKLYTPASGRVQ